LPHLREAVYENLIEVEKQIFKNGIEIFDFDKDGKDEVVVESKDFGVFVKPSYGGSIFEIDLKKYNKNLLNVLTRRKEAYHNRLIEFEKNNSKLELDKVKTIHDLVLVKEPGLSKKLYYDWYIRYSFLDHFLHPNTKFEDFYKCQFGEQGNFTIESYDIEEIDKKNLSIILSRKGSVWIDEKEHSLLVKKKYVVDDENKEIICEYHIENLSNTKLNLWFLTELNLMLFSISSDLFGEKISDSFVVEEGYKGFKLSIFWSPKILLWCFPIETISLSEGGFERTYQGICVAPNFKFSLKPKESYNINLKLKVE
jgi:alpha-amylase